jgi:DNA-binding protein YbaB
MSAGSGDAFQRAEQELMRVQAKLQEVQDKLQDTVTKVRSKDRMVTVTIGPNGQVQAIDFHTQKFRQMAPAELGSVLAQTLRQAQVQARQRVLRACQPLVPPGSTGDGTGGPRSAEQFFEEVRRVIAERTSPRGPDRNHQGKDDRG